MAENEKKSAMRAHFDLENELYEQKEKPVETKSTILWGGLSVLHYAKEIDWNTVLHYAGEIDWNTVRNLYGEFMSKQMGLR